MSSNYTHDGQQRILKLLTALSGNEVAGITPSALAKIQSCSQSLVTRDLDNLRTAGFAEQTRTGTWRLSPHLVQMSIRISLALVKAEGELAEIKHRFMRS